MKRAFGLRLTSSTSSVAPPPRSTITEAAGRGVVGGPRFSSSPGPGLSSPIAGHNRQMSAETKTTQRWICESCGFIYDPDEGDPDGGIAPGTPFEDIPDDWFCPVCGARKRDFTPFDE